jgi:hypothetical protein
MFPSSSKLRNRELPRRLWSTASVITPVPAPSSAIVSTLFQSIPASIDLTRKRELGNTLPTVTGQFTNRRKNNQGFDIIDPLS